MPPERRAAGDFRGRRLHSSCADHPTLSSVGPQHMTASFGVANFGPTTAQDAATTTWVDSLLHSAETALSRGKHTGRNCVNASP